MKRAAAAPPAPRRVVLETTYRCSLRCSFCYLAHAGRLGTRRCETGARRWLRFARTLPRGTEFFVTGGEPFVRADCLALLAGLKRAGHRCGVNTNGTRLAGDLPERLAAARPDYVLFSLHGLAPVHDRLSGRRGAFRSLLRGALRFARARRPGTELILSCTVTPENAGSLAEVAALGRRLGADRVLFEHLQFMRPVRGGPEVLTARYRRPLPGAARLARSLRALARIEGGPRLEVRPALGPAELARWYGGEPPAKGACRAPSDTLVVEPDGTARVCQNQTERAGNVLEEGWKPVWRGPVLAAFRRRAGGRLPPGCARCCQRFPLTPLGGGGRPCA